MFFLDAFLKGLHKQGDDDSIDRLNYYWTPMLLVIFALTLSAKQYVGQPIQCWIPAQFTGAWEQYSENYCFVQNTYFIRPEKYIPDSEIDREAAEIGYYQWVPFILGLQAIMFYLPSLLWRLMNFNSGVALKKMLFGAKKADRVNEAARHEAAKATGAHLYESLSLQSRFAKYNTGSALAYSGSYLTKLYLFCKVLYLVQIVLQFVILNNFLGTSYTFWGAGILSDILNGREWEESGHFPRVTMCDFEVRVLGNKHRHTVQCVLMINMFNEKVYVFLWFWLVIVGVVTFLNLVNWTRKLLFRSSRKAHIVGYLQVDGLVDENTRPAVVDKFVDHKLKADGVFITHLIDNNGGSVFSHDVIVDMWDRFLQEEGARSEKKQPEFREI
uniref:Innexin n=1 Tax=Caenorhabditis japonica TaxID=281687 RepID=A0A8R1DNY5_CAEJA